MQEPAYKPDHWVVYQQGETGGFGKIVGASYDGASWHYSVAGPIIDTTYASVREDAIIRLFENGSWLEPRHASGAGSASAYTDQVQ